MKKGSCCGCCNQQKNCYNDRNADCSARFSAARRAVYITNQVYCKQCDSQAITPELTGPEPNSSKSARCGYGFKQDDCPCSHAIESKTRAWIEPPHRLKETFREQKRKNRCETDQRTGAEENTQSRDTPRSRISHVDLRTDAFSTLQSRTFPHFTF